MWIAFAEEIHQQLKIEHPINGKEKQLYKLWKVQAQHKDSTDLHFEVLFSLPLFMAQVFTKLQWLATAG